MEKSTGMCQMIDETGLYEGPSSGNVENIVHRRIYFSYSVHAVGRLECRKVALYSGPLGQIVTDYGKSRALTELSVHSLRFIQ